MIPHSEFKNTEPARRHNDRFLNPVLYEALKLISKYIQYILVSRELKPNRNYPELH
jgi:hypothetical protein